MIKKLFIFVGIVFFVVSCQNRNQVTHNKRKYRKGYYKPNRTKVKHRKTHKEEAYTYKHKSKTEKENSVDEKKGDSHNENAVVDEQKTSDDQRREEEKIVESNNENTLDSDRITFKDGENNGSSSPTSNDDLERKPEKEGKEKTIPERNWMYWLDFALIWVLLALLFVTLFVGIALESVLFSVLMFIGTFLIILLGIITAGINIKNTKGDSEKNFIRVSSHIYIIIFVLILLLAAGLCLIFLI